MELRCHILYHPEIVEYHYPNIFSGAHVLTNVKNTPEYAVAIVYQGAKSSLVFVKSGTVAL